MPRYLEFWQYLRDNDQYDPLAFLQYILDELQKAELPNNRYKLADLCNVEHRSALTCSDCGVVHNKPEVAGEGGHGVGLSVQIQEPRRGLPMLADLQRNDYEARREIRCESPECIEKYGAKCDGKTRTLRKLITKAPEILFMSLVRFDSRPNPRTGIVKNTKIKDGVIFEEYLNLREFTESEEPLFYKLQGVVAHSGKTIDGGHFIAAVRNRDGKTFCSLNDDKDPEIRRFGTIDELESPRSVEQNFDPYLLVYSKM